MKNVLVNWSWGDKCIESIDGEIFLKSLKVLPNNVDRVCFVKDISLHNIELLKKYFNIIVQSTEKDQYSSHFDIYKWLIDKQDHYEYVLQTDLRDVIFQKNPFEFFNTNKQYDMFYCLEGMQIKENDCNMFWHNHLQSILQHHNGYYADNLIINGGLIGGKVSAYCNHLLNIFTNTNRLNKYQVVDQQFLGYLYQFLILNPKIKMCHPYDDNFCATGEAIKRNNIEVKYNDTTVCNLQNEPYYVFHQWDRTEIVDKIRNKHKNALSFIL